VVETCGDQGQQKPGSEEHLEFCLAGGDVRVLAVQLDALGSCRSPSDFYLVENAVAVFP